ncbi:hypothetical protein PR048_009319 [Dryococelus australis]|uniref:Uncharacterized protein n=1 Tax=Dryococelus australis TaxID=614101 RepID=A0ABQ9HZM5_9NEOP|nr:hypothetical protein PR048_009319 [Dryococelus australis]
MFKRAKKIKFSECDKGEQTSISCECKDQSYTNCVDHLFDVTTINVDRKVRECATEQESNVLLAKLCGGEMIAIYAKSHSKCLEGLYNK